MKMIRTPIHPTERLILRISSVAFLVIAYLLLANHQYNINPNNTVIPTIKGFGQGFVNIFKARGWGDEVSIWKSWFFVDATASLERLSIAITISVVIGTILGILMGCFQRIESLFDWLLTFFCKITPTGAMAVFFALFGTDIKMFLSVIVFGVTPTMTISIMQSIKSMPENYIHKAYTLGFSTIEVVISVVGRYVLPSIIDTIRLTIGPAIIFLIAAEGLAASQGFGFTMRTEGKLSHVNVVLIYLCMLAGFGFFIDWLLKLSRAKLCSWLGEGK